MSVNKNVTFAILCCLLILLCSEVPALAQPDDPKFGIQLSPINALPHGLPYGSPRNVLVVGVLPKSPAEAIGIVPGDVIEYSGYPASFANSLKAYPVGTSFDITVERGKGVYPHSIVSTKESLLVDTCDKAGAQAEFASAVQGDHNRDITDELVHAKKALDEYESCFFNDKTADVEDLLEVGNSYLLIATAYRREGGGRDDQDQYFLTVAHAFYRSFLTLDGVSPDLLASAQRKLKVIELALPQSNHENDHSILIDMLQAKRSSGKPTPGTAVSPISQPTAPTQPIGN